MEQTPFFKYIDWLHIPCFLGENFAKFQAQEIFNKLSHLGVHFWSILCMYRSHCRVKIRGAISEHGSPARAEVQAFCSIFHHTKLDCPKNNQKQKP
jgi:hypothetical protein